MYIVDALPKLEDEAIKLRNVLTKLRNSHCVDISENGVN
jgi:hypothetical protein